MKSKISEEIKQNTTPLEDLLFWLESFEEMLIKPTYTNMKEKIWQLLPKEKQQIIDAYIEGLNEPIENPLMQSEQYYNEKYK